MLKDFYDNLIKTDEPFIMYPDGQTMSVDKLFESLNKEGEQENKNPIRKTLTFPKMGISLIPGSFNPLHDGHKSLYESAKSTSPADHVFFEISLSRRDKDFLSFEDLKNRLRYFVWYAPVLITNQSTLKNKSSNVFKFANYKNLEIAFHIGYDTAKRFIEDDGAKNIETYSNTFYYVYPRMSDGVVLGYFSLKDDCVTKYNFFPNRMASGNLLDLRYVGLSSTEIRNNGNK